WSGNSQHSDYSVIFDPGVGVELAIEEPFKALRFTIKSGSVLQRLTNLEGCSTFSFNINTSHGSDAFGDFIVEPNGIFISECNSGIIFRSGTASNSRPA